MKWVKNWMTWTRYSIWENGSLYRKLWVTAIVVGVVAQGSLLDVLYNWKMPQCKAPPLLMNYQTQHSQIYLWSPSEASRLIIQFDFNGLTVCFFLSQNHTNYLVKPLSNQVKRTGNEKEHYNWKLHILEKCLTENTTIAAHSYNPSVIRGWYF